MSQPAQALPARQESAFVLIALVAAILPIVVVVGASLTSMTSKLHRLEAEIDEEQALAAAEAGIDLSIYRASTAIGLASGVGFTRDLGGGLSFTVMPTFLKTDGIDNDGDAQVDETDENVYQVLVTGTYRSSTRRLVAYLGPASSPISVPFGAVTFMNAGSELRVEAGGQINGLDKLINGSAGSAANDRPGVVVEPPGTVANLKALTDDADEARVLGTGTAPSFGVAGGTYDINAIRLMVQNSANIVPTSTEYTNANFGNASLGQYNIVYKSGDFRLRGSSRGAGILFVTGEFRMEDTSRWDGIVFVLGELRLEHSTKLYGGAVTGPASVRTRLDNAVANRVYFSLQAISSSTATVPGKYSSFNGWQEIARN